MIFIMRYPILNCEFVLFKCICLWLGFDLISFVALLFLPFGLGKAGTYRLVWSTDTEPECTCFNNQSGAGEKCCLCTLIVWVMFTLLV